MRIMCRTPHLRPNGLEQGSLELCLKQTAGARSVVLYPSCPDLALNLGNQALKYLVFLMHTHSGESQG